MHLRGLLLDPEHTGSGPQNVSLHVDHAVAADDAVRDVEGAGGTIAERGELAGEGVRMLCVLTLGPSVPEDAADNYADTRAFYRAAGFVPLRELELQPWNDAYALILARAL